MKKGKGKKKNKREEYKICLKALETLLEK